MSVNIDLLNREELLEELNSKKLHTLTYDLDIIDRLKEYDEEYKKIISYSPDELYELQHSNKISTLTYLVMKQRLKELREYLKIKEKYEDYKPY